MILQSMTNVKTSFDASNVEHRKLFSKFIQTNSWKHTNIRFKVELDYVDVPTTITNKLINFYMLNDKEITS